jgi:hypothetical protein
MDSSSAKSSIRAILTGKYTALCKDNEVSTSMKKKKMCGSDMNEVLEETLVMLEWCVLDTGCGSPRNIVFMAGENAHPVVVLMWNGSVL